mgnify:CR=1 FL=1
MTRKTVSKTEEVCEDGVCRFPNASSDESSLTTSPTRMADVTWRIFRIMAEFVDGFQFISTHKRDVTVFGSARLPEDNHWYQEMVRLTRRLGEAGFTIVTGGGPGIMEAANKGAYEAGAPSVGINIQLPMEQRINPYVTRGKAFYYFFTRKVIMTASGQAYVFGPGGFGTLDEVFEILTLIQTNKMAAVPVVLMSHDFWDPLLDFLRATLRDGFETISPEDLELFHIVDTAEEAFELIKDSKERSFF